MIAERAIQDRGYFRARMVLTNGDFLEISEWQGQVIQEAGLRDFCASRTAPDVYLQRGTYGSHYADYQYVLWDHYLPLLL